MSPKHHHSPFEFEASDIATIELLKVRPQFDRGLLHSLGLRGLHCGCGLHLFAGCLNTDYGRLTDRRGNESRGGRMARVNGGLFYMEHDATQPIPIKSGSFEWVYSEHFIEHLQRECAIAWLRDVHRVLIPGGLLRLTTPDLARYIEGYMDNRRRFFTAHRKRVSHLFPDGAPARRAWMMNQIFYCWEHRWLYDFDEIVHAAKQVGFAPVSVIRCSYRQGQLPELCALDWDFRNDESLYVEMTKQPVSRLKTPKENGLQRRR